MEDKLSSPKPFLTLQMYLPLFSSLDSLMINKLSLTIKILSSDVSVSPSFSQVTAGVGTPLTGHLIVMVVFEAAVTLSPIFIVTGLPSPAGISFPVPETSTIGFLGSRGKNNKAQLK